MSIIVIGMHRSGTSAIASLIEAMGAYAGTPGDMIPATNDNPKGFFERRDVLEVNRMLMQYHSCNWHDISRFDMPTPPIPLEIFDKMRQIVARLNLHYPYVIKDPRFCYTLPYWLPYIANPVIVVASRHPSFIAHSLKIRNDMPIEQGMALWQDYMTRGLNNIRGLPVVHCQYEELLTDPHMATEILHRELSKYIFKLTIPQHTPIDSDLQSANPALTALNDMQHVLYMRVRG